LRMPVRRAGLPMTCNCCGVALDPKTTSVRLVRDESHLVPDPLCDDCIAADNMLAVHMEHIERQTGVRPDAAFISPDIDARIRAVLRRNGIAFTVRGSGDEITLYNRATTRGIE
jgi:hypothetical protein